jgi:hypothetical protein
MPDMPETESESYTVADEENNSDYSSTPKEAMNDPDMDGLIEEDIYDESPVGDLDTGELYDKEATAQRSEDADLLADS